MPSYGIYSNIAHGNALDLGAGSIKAFIDDFGRNPNRLEYLCASVTFNCRNTHLRHDFKQAFFNGLSVIC